MPDFKFIKYEQSSGICIIRLNRPEVLNALSMALVAELKSAISIIENDNNARVLIITGEGSAFAAGGDIKDMYGMDTEQALKASFEVQGVFNSLSDLKIPVIAAVNGIAVGGGSELASACDFCVASSDAKFGFPESKLGIIPGGSGTQKFSRIAGVNNAIYYLMTGEFFDAATAIRLGLVQKISEPGAVLEESLAIANYFVSVPAEVLFKLKMVIRKGAESDYKNACILEAQAFSELVGGIGKSGMKKFIDKVS